MGTGELSVIIPSWREGPRLLEAVRAARRAIGGGELVVVASEETAETRGLVHAEGASWIDAPRACRGLQLALGAERSAGGVLAFLHADTRLPGGASGLIRQALVNGAAGGAFRLRFDRAHAVLDALARMSAMTWRASYFGDQCLFCTRHAYEAAGGFHPEPLFEDVDFVCRLSRVGPLVRIGEPVTTSARRFAEEGPFRQLALNGLLLVAHHAGIGSERLSAIYQPVARPVSVPVEP